MADRRDSSVDRQVGRGAQQPRSLRRFFRAAAQFQGSGVSIRPMAAPVSALRQRMNAELRRMGGIQRGGEAVCWVIALVPRIAQGISPMRALSRSAKDAAAFVKEEG